MSDQVRVFVCCNGPERPRAGLGSHILQAVATIAEARKFGCRVHIDFDDRAMDYYVPGGVAGTLNVWEYYFEQTGAPPAPGEQVVTCDHAMLGIVLDPNRSHLAEAIADKVKLKPHIAAKITAFERANFHEHRVLGVHYRGTDMRTTSQVPSYNAFIGDVKRHAPERIFLATDERGAVEAFRRAFGAAVVMANVPTGSRPLHTDIPLERRYEVGENAIVDAFLLARCKYILRIRSNLSEFSTWINPDLRQTIVRP